MVDMQRHARHLVLPQVGIEGQEKLAKAKVFVVGAGGLGSPALLYLAAAGVGTIGVIDDDLVDISNLQRQVLHRTEDVGRMKVDSAKEQLLALDPNLNIVEYRERLSPENA
ncbi:MAG TPA: adenylyltransferase, partial [Candidatus Poseidoniales archaeon]